MTSSRQRFYRRLLKANILNRAKSRLCFWKENNLLRNELSRPCRFRFCKTYSRQKPSNHQFYKKFYYAENFHPTTCRGYFIVSFLTPLHVKFHWHHQLSLCWDIFSVLPKKRHFVDFRSHSIYQHTNQLSFNENTGLYLFNSCRIQCKASASTGTQV